MYIGIIGAMEEEITNLKASMENIQVKKIKNKEFYIGKLSDKNVILVTCDEGMVNSAIYTQMLIDNFDMKFIMNVGIAGSIDNNIKLLDIVIAQSAVEHGYDITKLGYEAGLVLGINKVYIPCDENLSKKLYDITKKNNEDNKVKMAIVASGDVFITQEEKKKEINTKFNAVAVDMESASIAHTCYVNNIPFICMRIISDSSDAMEYREFANLAVKKIKSIVLDYLKDI